MFCITKQKAEKFREALISKKLNIEELIKLPDTASRIKALEPFLGIDAKAATSLIEQKLILKDKLTGLKNAISKLSETGRYSPTKKAQLAEALSEFRSQQRERIFSPKEEQTFLGTMAEKILGTEITVKESKIAWDFQSKANELFKNVDMTSPDPQLWKWKEGTEKAQAEYGATKQIYKKYIDNLKTGNLPVKGMAKEYGKEIKQLWKEDKYEASKKIVADAIFGLSKTMINAVASWDNSFLGRQGAITLVKSPKTWWNMAGKSMTDFYKTIKGQSPQDVLMAEIYSDIDYINGNYQKAKLSFGVEEEVPIQILERLPVVGRIFKASDVSFLDSAIRARRGLFKIQKKIYEAKGIPLDDVVLKDIGTVINAITARGKVGMFLGSKPTQLLLWAPKMMKADWDVLTAHTFGYGLKTKTARIQAVKTITNVVIATAGVTAIAEAMGATVEKNPLSTDFLAIRIGNTRIKTPFGRGMPQIVTLFSRLLTQKTKYSTGIMAELNSGDYGSRSLFDVGIDFLVNKTTPPVSAVLSWFRGRNFAGQKPTLAKTAFGFLPISVQNFIQLKDEASTESVIGAFVDLFGVSSNTYIQEVDWSQSTTKEMTKFKEKVSEKEFKEANNRYNQEVADWLTKMRTDKEFQALSNDDKQSEITSEKAKIKKKILNI